MATKKIPKPRVCIDRVLPEEVFRRQAVMRPRGVNQSRAVIEFRKLWINGSTLRVRFIGGNANQRAIAREQALWWN
ncbi:MAG: hypothetical protein ACFCUG_05480 [Thiotrichales bacterium]